MAQVTRGRVVARDGDALLVRAEGGEVTVTGEARPGDLVTLEAGGVRVVRAFSGGDYPAPASERARLTPQRLRGLRVRAQVLAAVRQFFAGRGFLEIEAPLLVRAPALEIHLEAVEAGDGYLITSPEFQMKRLLAGGLERLFSVCRCFRAGERGHQHSVEFTMLEWYRAWAGLDDILADTEALVESVARAVRGEAAVIASGRRIDVSRPWHRVSVRDCFAEHVDVELAGDEPAELLAARLRAAGVDVGGATEWDDLFFAAFVAWVEPALAALDRAVVVTDWPAPLGALARRSPADPRVVERFEAYLGGIELANAFGELTCPVEQRARFVADQETRRRRGLPVYPLDDRLLAALDEGLPPSGGIALGIDRLAMLAAGADDIREVSAFLDDEL